MPENFGNCSSCSKQSTKLLHNCTKINISTTHPKLWKWRLEATSQSRSVTAAARCWRVSQQLLMSAKSEAGGSCLPETLHPTRTQLHPSGGGGGQVPEDRLPICWRSLRKSTNRKVFFQPCLPEFTEIQPEKHQMFCFFVSKEFQNKEIFLYHQGS